MSDINSKRAFVYDLYSSKGWKHKVEKMSDAQVVAIFLRNQEKPKEESKEESDDDPIPF